MVRIREGLLKPHILIVEDIPTLAESYAAYLRREDADVAIVETGAAALASLERKPANVVVLDVNLPDMSGLEVACPLKSGPP